MKSAKDIDFAVDQLLMQTHAFHEELSIRVSELSGRIMAAVTPFFVSYCSEELSAEVAEIEGFVRRALKLKSDLLISPYSYNLVTFQPGCIFDPNTMRIDRENGNSLVDQENLPSTVKLCVSPALVRGLDRRDACEQGQLERNEFDETTFNHNNFVQEILGEREVVTRAVVLLK
jgi:hypothetical protein